jgi:hypothetical protein
MPTSAFVFLSPNIWRLDGSIADPKRRDLLLSPPSFEAIVSELCKSIAIKAIRSERKRSWEGPPPLPVRVIVILEVLRHKHLVDLFHNSAAGVRAQCLRSIELGGAALNYARDRLRNKANELAADKRIGGISRDVVFKSLELDSTKVWIHQGLWVRHARIADRQLRIARWEANEPSANRKVKNLLRYGSKAPERPAAIDLIGGWIHPSDVAVSKDPSIRPHQIHCYGFT